MSPSPTSKCETFRRAAATDAIPEPYLSKRCVRCLAVFVPFDTWHETICGLCRRKALAKVGMRKKRCARASTVPILDRIRTGHAATDELSRYLGVL